MKATQIRSETDAGLYDIFADVGSIPLSLLDIEKDLNSVQRELLCDAGVLIDSQNSPRKPFFECMLSDVEPSDKEIDPNDLVVNPTFEFHSVDIANFSSWLNEKHLSPYHASAWIRSPYSGISLGYWLNDIDTRIVENFAATQPLPAGIDRVLAAKLYAAEILIRKEEFDEEHIRIRNVLDDAHRQFESNKYTVLSGMVPRAQMNAMRKYYRRYVENGFMPFGDVQVPGRYRQHNEPFAALLHKELADLMGSVVGSPVKCSYVYAASYVEGAVLEPHTDREQCEYSISFQVDYEPETPDGISPWAIFLDSPETGPVELHLANGDGLFYKGRELVHYRHALPAGHRSTSLFFHFVDTGFDGSLT